LLKNPGVCTADVMPATEIGNARQGQFDGDSLFHI
jgi:hypothetical protein